MINHKSLTSLKSCHFLSWGFYVLFQTRETVFHRDEIIGAWIAAETLSRMFDISSQSKREVRSKRRRKNRQNLC